MSGRSRPESSRAYVVDTVRNFLVMDIQQQTKLFLELESSKDNSKNFIFFVIAELGKALHGITPWRIAVQRAAGYDPNPDEFRHIMDREPNEGAIMAVWADKNGNPWPTDSTNNPIMTLPELYRELHKTYGTK